MEAQQDRLFGSDSWRWGLCLVAGAVVHAAAAYGMELPSDAASVKPQPPMVTTTVFDIDLGAALAASEGSSQASASAAAPAAAAAKVVPAPAVRRHPAALRSPTPPPEITAPESVTERELEQTMAAAPTVQPLVKEGNDRRVAASAATIGSGKGKANGVGKGQLGSGRGRAGRGAAGRGSGSGHGPRLLATGNPCQGLFPYDATDDQGLVTVSLKVSQNGLPSNPRLIDEKPKGQGFARAARACVDHLSFRPAEDPTGHPVAATSVVRLRFVRRW